MKVCVSGVGCVLAGFAVACGAQALARQPPTAVPASTAPGNVADMLDAVVVKGQIFAADSSGFTANVLDGDQIRARHVTRMQDLFQEIPGMWVSELG